METVENSGIETSVANAGLSQPGVAGSLSCCLKGNEAYEWSNSKSLVIREHIKQSILYQLVCRFLVGLQPNLLYLVHPWERLLWMDIEVDTFKGLLFAWAGQAEPYTNVMYVWNLLHPNSVS